MKTNKEMKNEYKHMKKHIGVFQIKNVTNGKIFIEGCIDMNARWNRHIMELKFGTHKNVALQLDWRNSGEENFIFEVLSDIKQKEDDKIDYANEVKELEEMYLEELKPFDDIGYNIRSKEK